MFHSIVWFEEGEHKKTAEMLQCAQDLNLDEVFSFITKNADDYHLENMYYYLPTETTRIHRLDVLNDCKNPKIFQQLKEFISDYHTFQERLIYEQECNYKYQCMKLSLDNRAFYCKMLRKLEKCLKDSCITSSGLKQLLRWLQEEIFQPEYIQKEQKIYEIDTAFSQLSFSICYEGAKINQTQGFLNDKKSVVRIINHDVEEKSSLNYQDKIITLLSLGQVDEMKENYPFADTKEINDLERNIVRILKKINPKPFQLFEEWVKNPPTIYKEELNQLVQEVVFYTSYIEYMNYMEQMGYWFCNPMVTSDSFQIVNGYDMALALQCIEKDKKIVPNSCDYYNEERFFVVTGPNQGGKTTFARMLGQQVYIAQLGFMAPASAAKIPSFRQVYSHFASEEINEIGAGKLKEELIRLKPILDKIEKKEEGRSFVIINELFTTAATYDAVFMGHKVMDYLCNSDCYGVYVTHVRELSEGKEQVVSLVAEVMDDEAKTRTYHITRNPSAAGYAQSVAYKYGLTYDQMRRRVPK